MAVRRLREAASLDPCHADGWKEEIQKNLDAAIYLFIQADERLVLEGASPILPSAKANLLGQRARRGGQAPHVRVSYAQDALFLTRLVCAAEKDDRQTKTWRDETTSKLRAAIVLLHRAEMAAHNHDRKMA
jgi:hypothetical protein